MEGLPTELAAPEVGDPTDKRPRVEDFAYLPADLLRDHLVVRLAQRFQDGPDVPGIDVEHLG